VQTDSFGLSIGLHIGLSQDKIKAATACAPAKEPAAERCMLMTRRKAYMSAVQPGSYRHNTVPKGEAAYTISAQQCAKKHTGRVQPHACELQGS
jgi:hypothetical protein